MLMRSGFLLPAALTAALSVSALGSDQDYFLSVPVQGAIMRVDAQTLQASVFTPGVLIPHYGWFEGDVLYMPDRGWPALLAIDAQGNAQAVAAGAPLKKPVTVIPAPGGGLLLSDTEAQAIFHVEPATGAVSVFADMQTTNGLLTGPDGLALDAQGNLYAANLVGDTIVRIDPQGNATLFSDSPLVSQPGGVAIDNAGNMFVAMYGASTIVRFRLDTGEAEVFAEDLVKIKSPSDLKLSRSGGLVASTRNSNIVRIHADGSVDVVFHDASFGDIVGVSVPADQTLCGGWFEEYGQGKAGSGGFTPRLRAIFSPCPGQEIGIELRDFPGGSVAYLLLGAAPASQPVLGGEMLVDLTGWHFVLPVPLPGQGPGEGDLVLPFVVPDDPALVGLELYYQGVAADPGATFGAVFSNGLKEHIGS